MTPIHWGRSRRISSGPAHPAVSARDYLFHINKGTDGAKTPVMTRKPNNVVEVDFRGPRRNSKTAAAGSATTQPPLHVFPQKKETAPKRSRAAGLAELTRVVKQRKHRREREEIGRWGKHQDEKPGPCAD
jgi:hypothetical protein